MKRDLSLWKKCSLLLVPACLLTVVACSAELKKLSGDKDSEVNTGTYPYPQYPNYPGTTTGNGDATSSCSADDLYSVCSKAPFFVHYMLDKEIGDHLNVVVEAFTSKEMQGAPAASQEVSGFDAEKGSWKKVELSLKSGEYYVRAYVTNEEGGRNPYVFGGLEPVEDNQTKLLYGAMSDTQIVKIGNGYETLEPVNLMINRLFEKPGQGLDTNARLRLKLSVAANLPIDDGKNIHIELRHDTDLSKNAVQTFTLPSESLLVQSHLGTTEFVTPNLPEGQYIVFVYIDSDENDFYDAGELAQIYRENDTAKLVDLKRDMTKTLLLELTDQPTLPFISVP